MYRKHLLLPTLAGWTHSWSCCQYFPRVESCQVPWLGKVTEPRDRSSGPVNHKGYLVFNVGMCRSEVLRPSRHHYFQVGSMISDLGSILGLSKNFLMTSIARLTNRLRGGFAVQADGQAACLGVFPPLCNKAPPFAHYFNVSEC